MIPLLIANLAPLLGALFLGWGVSEVLIAYWLETVAIGVLTLPRIALAGRGDPVTPGSMTRIPMMLFFTVHYGGFSLVHGLFIGLITAGNRWSDPDRGGLFEHLPNVEPVLGLAGIGLLVGLLFEFVQNDLRSGALAGSTPQKEMVRPYKRVFVQHLTVMAGGAALMFSGFSGTLPAVVAIVVKVVIEILVFRLRQAKEGIIAGS